MKFSFKTLFKNLFGRNGKVIVLDEGALSSKIVLVGTMGQKPTFGVLQIRRYKDKRLHEYGQPIREEDIGDLIATIVFGRREGIKKLADSLDKLYESMEGAE